MSRVSDRMDDTQLDEALDRLRAPLPSDTLVARVKSMLRIKCLNDRVQEQNEELGEWNRALEDRVAKQLAELERVGRLRRFFSPQIADIIVSEGGEEENR